MSHQTKIIILLISESWQRISKPPITEKAARVGRWDGGSPSLAPQRRPRGAHPTQGSVPPCLPGSCPSAFREDTQPNNSALAEGGISDGKRVMVKTKAKIILTENP